VQSLSEFFSAITRPKKGDPPRLSVEEALSQTDVISRTFPIFDLTPEIVLEAGRGVRDFRLVYYDAQIWATARVNEVSVIFSEDFQDHTSIEGITFLNPFLPEFNIEDWA